MKTELWATQEREFFFTAIYGKMGCGHSFAYQHSYCNRNVWRFSKLWTAVKANSHVAICSNNLDFSHVFLAHLI